MSVIRAMPSRKAYLQASNRDGIRPVHHCIHQNIPFAYYMFKSKQASIFRSVVQK